MTIEKSKQDKKLTMKLCGRLDTVTAPDLEAALKSNLEGVADLVFDLAELEYVSSAGLRTLLMAQKIMNTQGSMRIINVCEIVREIFEITGCNSIFTIE